jgi:hypothetical protein
MNCITTTTTVCEPCVHLLKYFFEISTLYDVNSRFYNTHYEVIDRFLDKGVSLPNCKFCCPDCNDRYVLASVETYLKYAEAVGLTGDNAVVLECCTNVYGDIDRYNGFVEGVVNFTSCCNDFSKCIEDYICWASDKISNVNSFFALAEKGIVESGQFLNNCTGENIPGICVLLNLIKEYYEKPSSLLYNVNGNIPPIDILIRFLDRGIVIECSSGKINAWSVESFLKYAEAVGQPKII